MNRFQSGWYVIYTKPRHEKKVHSWLAEKNLNSFLPTKKVLRTWHDRKKYVDEPLFPSYIFIYLNDLNNYYEGINADGSLYYVKTGKEIARINESVVNNIRLVTDGAEELEISDKRFQPGEQLYISKGPLTGLSCEVVKSDNAKKLLVRIDLLQRNILLTLPVEQVIAI